MSSTTVSAQQSQTREHRVAAGLIELADMIYAGHIPEPTYSDQAVRLELIVPTADDVRSIAGRMDRPVIVSDRHTSTEIPIGQGSHAFPRMIEFTAAVILRVTHIAPTEAV